jgi:hypothetical protein
MTYSAFDGHRLLASGPLLDVTLAVKSSPGLANGTVLTFDDDTGKVIDLDLQGSDDQIIARHHARAEGLAARSRGRPKLGVVAREVTLLPRHWEWLAAQRGGASVTLRRLIDEARKSQGGQSAVRAARDSAYRFMSAIAGDLPAFEEAVRALYAGDSGKLAREMDTWPEDLQAYVRKLAAPSISPETADIAGPPFPSSPRPD